MNSQESDDESTSCQEMPLCNIGADTQEYLDTPFQATKQTDEILLEKFKSGCFNTFKFLENDKKEHKVKIQRRFQLTRVYINRERKRTQRVAINQKGF